MTVLKKISFKHKLILSFLVITTFSVLFTTGFSLIFFYGKVKDEAIKTMRNNIDVAYIIYTSKIDEVRRYSQMLAGDKTLLILSDLDMRKKLSEYVKMIVNRESVYHICMRNTEGEVIVNEGALGSLLNKERLIFDENESLIFERAKKGEFITTTEIVKTVSGTEVASILAVAPVIRNDKFIGVIYIRYILNNNPTIVNHIKSILDVEAFLYYNGTIISSTMEESTLTTLDTRMPEYDATFETIDIRFGGRLEEFHVICDYNQKPLCILGISISADSIFGTFHQALITFVIIMLICIILAYFLARFLSRGVLTPINRLLTGVNRIASGDLSYNINVSGPKDEIGTLSKAFNNMRMSLKEKILMIESLNENLEQTVRERTYELEEVNRKLHLQNDRIQHFTTNVAHETKTPLTLLYNYLTEYFSRPELSNNEKIILDSLKQLKHIIENLFDVQAMQMGRTLFDHTNLLELRSYLTNKTLMFESTARKKDITIHTDINQEDMYAMIAPEAFDKVINNLLENAYKYTPQGGTITIGLKAVNQRILLSVADSGVGIPENMKDTIFERYYQASKKKSNKQGIGLGLYIVKSILDEVHAPISFTSTVGQGTCFTINFREYKKDSGNVLTRKISQEPVIDTEVSIELKEEVYIPGRGTILIVDDMKNIINFIQTSFYDNYNVYYAFNGKLALEKLGSIPKPDLIISDIMMDEMDGVEFFEHVHRNNNFKDIPFIFLTAKNSENDKIHALSEGAIDYLIKPFSIEELKAKVHSIIQNIRIRQSLYEKDKFATLGLLTGGICHEIANPLQMVYAPIDLLILELEKLKLNKNEKVSLYIERILSNIARIENIVQSMKVFTHQSTLEKDNIDIEKIIESLKEIFHSRIKDRITIQLIKEENSKVIGDENAVTHILLNLISNSIDAINDKGEIIVRLKHGNNKNYLIVKDSGCGMEQEKVSLIFNAFYTNKTVGEGSGLGLYIVKDLVLKMGWDIHVQSEVNKGTKFIMESTSEEV